MKLESFFVILIVLITNFLNAQESNKEKIINKAMNDAKRDAKRDLKQKVIKIQIPSSSLSKQVLKDCNQALRSKGVKIVENTSPTYTFFYNNFIIRNYYRHKRKTDDLIEILTYIGKRQAEYDLKQQITKMIIMGRIIFCLKTDKGKKLKKVLEEKYGIEIKLVYYRRNSVENLISVAYNAFVRERIIRNQKKDIFAIIWKKVYELDD